MNEKQRIKKIYLFIYLFFWTKIHMEHKKITEKYPLETCFHIWKKKKKWTGFFKTKKKIKTNFLKYLFKWIKI